MRRGERSRMTLLLIADAARFMTSTSLPGKRCLSCFRTIPGMVAVISYCGPNIEDSPRQSTRTELLSLWRLNSAGLNSGKVGASEGKYFFRYDRFTWYHSIPSKLTLVTSRFAPDGLKSRRLNSQEQTDL